MKFSSNCSDFVQSRKERKNEVKKCELSSFRDVNEIKLKLRIRRSKANARERNRMHGLNKALDRLRSTLPIKTLRAGMKHKLSKIETLKIACNYIRLLMNILKSDHDMEMNNFANTLAMGLSHTTANVVISSFSQIHRFYSGSSNLDFGNNLHQNQAVSDDWNKRFGL